MLFLGFKMLFLGSKDSRWGRGKSDNIALACYLFVSSLGVLLCLF